LQTGSRRPARGKRPAKRPKLPRPRVAPTDTRWRIVAPS
jgi:hypothetical protein